MTLRKTSIRGGVLCVPESQHLTRRQPKGAVTYLAPTPNPLLQPDLGCQVEQQTARREDQERRRSKQGVRELRSMIGSAMHALRGLLL